MITVDQAALDTLFHQARSQNGWRPGEVSDEELRAAYDIAKWGPTSMNTQPMRILFLRSQEGKEKLRPAMSPGNVDKVMTAPVVALIAFDEAFHRLLPKTFPHNPNAQSIFAGNEALIQGTAFRNGTLQGAYFLLALRAVGLDAGPMSGFDPAKVQEAFFAGTTMRINFICGIGHGDPDKVYNRSPRLDFEEATSIL
ncbi:MAG: malonic semialdehyde reductase [Sphingobium sp.]